MVFSPPCVTSELCQSHSVARAPVSGILPCPPSPRAAFLALSAGLPRARDALPPPLRHLPADLTRVDAVPEGRARTVLTSRIADKPMGSVRDLLVVALRENMFPITCGDAWTWFPGGSR